MASDDASYKCACRIIEAKKFFILFRVDVFLMWLDLILEDIGELD
jgi:hypothetical protein